MIRTTARAIAMASALAVAQVAVAASNPSPADFLKAAVQADNSEIMLGRMAEQNQTASPGVRDYARMLVEDHTANLQKAQALAKEHGVNPPSGPTVGADAESAKLHLLSGAAFNKEFTRYMIGVHQDAITTFRAEAAHHDGDVSRFAEATVPTLRKHLNAALNLEKR